MDERATAKLLIQAITNSLDSGMLIYDIHGHLLETTVEVLEALDRDGKLNLEEPDAELPAA